MLPTSLVVFAIASPFDPGPYTTASYELGTRLNPLPSLSPWHALVTVPLKNETASAEAVAHLPVFVFVTGFAGEEPAASYSELFSLISSHGVMLVALDRHAKGLLINYTAVAQSLDGPLEYVTGGGLAKDAQRHGAGAPNASAFLLGGHSAGNHVALRRLLSFGCGRVGGMVWLDPVDGADPFGLLPEFAIHPPRPVGLRTPALHVETGMDPRSVSKHAPACAPERLSNQRFFHAWRLNPVWQLNATSFGHMDIANDAAARVALLQCPGTHNATARALYRRAVAGAVGAFARGLIVEQSMAEAAAVLDGRVGAPGGIDVEYASQLQGRAPSQVRATCSAMTTRRL